MNRVFQWNQLWMQYAKNLANMTTCKGGRKVGCVFVRDNLALTGGFNGVPSKYPHPKVCARRELNFASGEGLEHCVCNHAEVNAITNAAKLGLSLKNSILYVTTHPCQICMGYLANIGIEAVYYLEDYCGEKAEKIAKHANITLIKMEMHK